VGRKAERSGVCALGRDRIQFDFEFEGKRYRPTIKRAPTEGNLDRALKQLQGIRERIARGTFAFADEFPQYRLIKHVHVAAAPRTCDVVFDRFLKHCESRESKKDLAFVTVYGYRHVLETVWRPAIGEKDFESVRYTDLLSVADGHLWSKKTYNNVISVVRCAFEFGYRDLPEKRNPAEGLKTLRITRKDRAPIDPFKVTEAEALIAGIHRDWGEAQGNYDEFRFFTGMRPSEEIALLVSDCDLVGGTVKVNKARVQSRDKDRTKTNVDRSVELCPRALEILMRQLALRDRLKTEGLIHHEKLFVKEDGGEISNLQFGYERWKKTLTHSVKIRYREPYNARHTCVTWNLMIGKNLLWASKQHGHSVQVMLTVYAAWIEGGGESEVSAIKAAMGATPAALLEQIEKARQKQSTSPASPSSPQELAVGWQYGRRTCANRLKKRRKWSRSVRAFDPYTLSRGAPSTTRPSLRGAQS